ncbi:hypothetical protein EDC01DRAFT_626791 [Geopyxis carbonaria]|nr:hypothetical protein EDC01DRAFT_626791 [Geopyxis carbonaria]
MANAFGFTLDEERVNLLKWLSSIPHHDLHRNESSRRSENTCEWLLKRPEFVHWRDSADSSILRLQGNPGCGKSVLMSRAVDHLLETYGSSTTQYPVLYFYCNFDDQKTLQPANLLSNLLKQLISTRPTIPTEITSAYKMQQLHGITPERQQFDDVKRYFVETLKQQEIESVFILVDGLDECPSTPKGQGRSLDSRAHVLKALSELVSTQPGAAKIKILVSSRPETDINALLEKHPAISIETSDTRADIKDYVNSQLAVYLEEGKPAREPIQNHPELKVTIIDTSTEHSQGM